MNPPNPEDPAARLIRRARSFLNETQEEFGRRVGLSRSSIANIEAGRQDVSLTTWLPLLVELGILHLGPMAPPPPRIHDDLIRGLRAVDVATALLQASRREIQEALDEVSRPGPASADTAQPT